MTQEGKQKNKIAALIEEADKIAIIPSRISKMDAFGAGVALYYMLQDVEKDVSFVYPGRILEKGKDLIDEENITQDIGKRSLLVSIDYSGTDASKVNYTTEDDVLYLNISPIPADFEKHRKVRSSVVGFDFDLIFVLGAQRMDDLGSIFRNLDSNSRTSKIINLDNTEMNERFGFVNIVDNKINSVSQLLMEKVPSWGLNISEKAAKALLEGIIASETPKKVD